jgi:cell division protein FtsI/penicillin-binding protein 2
MRASAALLGVALTLLSLPAPGGSDLPPQLDLGQRRVSDDGVTAPMLRGGRAKLTLDPRFDRAAARLLQAADPVVGSVIALDVRTGRVLALAEAARDGHRPGLAKLRAPAASVFKLVTTAALLESTTLGPSDRVCTAGGLRSVERRHLDLPKRSDAECAPFGQALGHSKNAVFAQLAVRRLLRGDLLATAERLGFNSLVPFDFKVPVGSLEVPYNDLEFARTAAGFQNSTLSPLGAAHLASIIARRGEAIRLRIVEQAGDFRAPSEAESLGRVLSRRTAERIARMMEVTVTSGTSRHAFADDNGRSYLPGIRVAGKTGTLKPSNQTLTTSWFVGFAPTENPEIVVSVLLQNGAVFRKKANEVARDMLRVIFRTRGRSKIGDPFERPAEPSSAISMIAPP